MKQAKKLKVFGLMTMLISMVFMVSSCSDDDTGGGALSYGKVTGVVTDDLSSPLEGVTVLVDGSGITATPVLKPRQIHRVYIHSKTFQ
jgi:hypothetical protein